MTDLEQGILSTDFYQLTMAQLYFKTGIHEHNVQFDYFFRKYPDYGWHQTEQPAYLSCFVIRWVMEDKAGFN